MRYKEYNLTEVWFLQCFLEPWYLKTWFHIGNKNPLINYPSKLLKSKFLHSFTQDLLLE